MGANDTRMEKRQSSVGANSLRQVTFFFPPFCIGFFFYS